MTIDNSLHPFLQRSVHTVLFIYIYYTVFVHLYEVVNIEMLDTIPQGSDKFTQKIKDAKMNVRDLILLTSEFD